MSAYDVNKCKHCGHRFPHHYSGCRVVRLKNEDYATERVKRDLSHRIDYSDAEVARLPDETFYLRRYPCSLPDD